MLILQLPLSYCYSTASFIRAVFERLLTNVLMQEWMLDFRLKAYRKWLTMAEPAWSDNR